MTLIIPKHGEDLMKLAGRCNAVYKCPKVNGIRTGPLVMYAGKDSQGRNLVGDDYFDFSKVEPHMEAVTAFTKAVYRQFLNRGLLNTFDTVCGIPEGGRTFGHTFAQIAKKRFVYATKKPKPTEHGMKQEFSWSLSRFPFERGERVAVAEDVFNNFQNTKNTLEVIADTGAEVVLLVGALNRSPFCDSIYMPDSGRFVGREFPVIASVRKAYPEYEQDDPEVAADMAIGNIELEVKDNWARLMAA